MLKAYKYRLYPTKGQAASLDHVLYLCRGLYNAALEERRTAYKKRGVSVSYYQQRRSLPELRAALPEYQAIHSQVLQDVVLRLDRAFKGFFRRVKAGEKPGFPRFQGRHRYNSFCYPQAGKTGAFAHPDSGKVMLSGIGNVRCKYHRPLEGTLKTATVKREGGEWYVIFTCEVNPRLLPTTGKGTAFDLGVEQFLTTRDGEVAENLRHFRSMESRLRKAQRRLMRRQRHSKRREKARLLVAKLHRKVARQRHDALHKLSRQLINEHDFIAMEALNIKGLARGGLAKSIHDAAWARFIEMLTYKAEWAGREVMAVDPRYTSQDCSHCGHRAQHGLAVRSWTCPACGARHQRDANAARNIWARAVPSGANVAVGDASVA